MSDLVLRVKNEVFVVRLLMGHGVTPKIERGTNAQSVAHMSAAH